MADKAEKLAADVKKALQDKDFDKLNFIVNNEPTLDPVDTIFQIICSKDNIEVKIIHAQNNSDFFTGK
jgi:hypothetical protein